MNMQILQQAQQVQFIDRLKVAKFAFSILSLGGVALEKQIEQKKQKQNLKMNF